MNWNRKSEVGMLQFKLGQISNEVAPFIRKRWALVKAEDADNIYHNVYQACYQRAYLTVDKLTFTMWDMRKNSCRILDSNGQGLVTGWTGPTEQG
jgi:hypothetical protein